VAEHQDSRLMWGMLHAIQSIHMMQLTPDIFNINKHRKWKKCSVNQVIITYSLFYLMALPVVEAM
jgi:hypothetical protein